MIQYYERPNYMPPHTKSKRLRTDRRVTTNRLHFYRLQFLRGASEGSFHVLLQLLVLLTYCGHSNLNNSAVFDTVFNRSCFALVAAVEKSSEVDDDAAAASEDDDLDEPMNEDEEVAPPNIEDDAEEGDTQNTSTKMLLDAFLGNLPNCVNREIIDSAAAEFCLNLNTKINRRKLVK